MKTTRAYDMTARAAQAEETRTRMLDAVIALAGEAPLAALTLPAVADRAGVSVQTVLRAWGSRDGLFDAARERGRAEVVAERETPVGDAAAAIDVLLGHYERRGDGVLLLLGQESWEPLAAEITDSGRWMHRDWVARVFDPFLRELDEPLRTERLDLLVVATDVYTWKLLRRDRGLSRDETAERMTRLVSALLENTA